MIVSLVHNPKSSPVSQFTLEGLGKEINSTTTYLVEAWIPELKVYHSVDWL